MDTSSLESISSPPTKATIQLETATSSDSWAATSFSSQASPSPGTKSATQRSRPDPSRPRSLRKWQELARNKNPQIALSWPSSNDAPAGNGERVVHWAQNRLSARSSVRRRTTGRGLGSAIFAPWERRWVRKGGVLDTAEGRIPLIRHDSAASPGWLSQSKAVIVTTTAGNTYRIHSSPRRSSLAEEVEEWKGTHGAGWRELLWDNDSTAGECNMARSRSLEMLQHHLGPEWDDLHRKQDECASLRPRKYGWRESSVYEAECDDFQEVLLELRRAGAMPPQRARGGLFTHGSWDEDMTHFRKVTSPESKRVMIPLFWGDFGRTLIDPVRLWVSGHCRRSVVHEENDGDEAFIFNIPLFQCQSQSSHSAYGSIDPLSLSSTLAMSDDGHLQGDGTPRYLRDCFEPYLVGVRRFIKWTSDSAAHIVRGAWEKMSFSTYKWEDMEDVQAISWQNRPLPEGASYRWVRIPGQGWRFEEFIHDVYDAWNPD
ncbi:hypothetical protein NA57DRAFT_73280 [Rhizodiscina lignyota]|uniref:Uncharacterized protein n=1 Tax=Rhizodiscina lignyota TaxID=1504668 RepID=A0A9P4IHV1_9PEZI|nr:hypothetical protein NA57DRAFT_73280 [Rhizodiscina lignyota]